MTRSPFGWHAPPGGDDPPDALGPEVQLLLDEEEQDEVPSEHEFDRANDSDPDPPSQWGGTPVRFRGRRP